MNDTQKHMLKLLREAKKHILRKEYFTACEYMRRCENIPIIENN